MLGTNEIVTKINTLISSGSLTQLQVTQLSGIVNSLEEHGVSAVATYSALPNPVLNTGRFFYITDEARYVFSNGVAWDISAIQAVAPVNLFSWGSNLRGQLGDNASISQSSPVSVSGGYTDWVQVACGKYHNIGVRADGTAWGWGQNGQGRVGDNSTVNKSSPVSVVGGFTDWVQVSASDLNSIGLRANGTAWTWGVGSTGALGDGTTVDKSSPVSVVGGFTDWTQVSAGRISNVGIRANGTAWGWGYNANGQLGDNSTVNKSSPVSVVGGFTDWVQVERGTRFALGVRANGTLWSWGNNVYGALGDNTTVNKSSPVLVVGGFTDWTQVSAGERHSLGLRANGTAWSWGGGNVLGTLGDGTTNDRSSPVSVVGGFTDWTQLAGGTYHNLGVRANGTAWAWGHNPQGQLGDGSGTNRTSPVSVVGGFTDWTQVSAGRYHSLGLRG